MGRGRDAVRMDDDEVRAFLEQTAKVQVATLNRDGSPHLATLFHVMHEGRLAFWTYGSSQKIKNLERDRRITCLVEDGEEYFELRGVTLTGTAEIRSAPEQVREVGTRVVQRMSGGLDLGDFGREEVERQVPKRVAVLVDVDRTASWDHRKLR
jgi:PPOX class probable F420-dependent enzyme